LASKPLVRNFKRRSCFRAQAGVGFFDFDHLVAIEGDEDHFARGAAEDPVFGIDAIVGFAKLAFWASQGQKYFVAVHSDFGLLFAYGLLGFGLQLLRVDFSRRALVELQNRRKDFLDLR
jgi:hypothetical protein